MDFKKIVKTQRAKLGLTLDDIARYVGVSGATVSRWESGDIENIRRDKIAKLAEILRVTPAYLMGWENEEGEQDLVLTAIDVARWMNASTEMVDLILEDMGWPDATDPEILSEISDRVIRKKLFPLLKDDAVAKELLDTIGKMSDSELRIVSAMARQMIAERAHDSLPSSEPFPFSKN